MKQGKTSSTKVAGVDVSKKHLDAAIHVTDCNGAAETARFANDAEGFGRLAAWLAERGAARIGLEASGGYEKGVRAFLEAEGFAVVLHQPLEVRLFARLKRQRAKNDRMDALIIAAATVAVDAVKAASDPYLSELAERMTAYEQAADLLAQMRTYREHTPLADLKTELNGLIRILAARKKTLANDLVRRIRERADLARRFDLIASILRFGKIIAAALVIRMPELGAMSPGPARRSHRRRPLRSR